MWKAFIGKLVWAAVGIVGALAFSDIGPQFAGPLRYLIGSVLILLFLWFLMPYLYMVLFKRVMSVIASREIKILEYLLKKHPNSHIVRFLLDPDYRNDTVYAVTAFVYKKDIFPTEFIWLERHATHIDLLPPGGRLVGNELPHEAILTRVSAETGIPKDELKFSSHFHKPYKDHLKHGVATEGEHAVSSHPLPIVIQTETVEQKGGIPFHYDFIYVLETTYRGRIGGEQNPSWLTMAALADETLHDNRFQNVRLLAEQLSNCLENGKTGPL